MHRALTLITVLLTLLQQNAFSQAGKRFSGEPGHFNQELTQFMGSNLPEKEAGELAEFLILWDSAAFNTGEMEMIVRTAVNLNAINARPVPHFINYIRLLSTVSEHDPQRRHYRVWEKAFDDILGEGDITLRKANEFILLTERLISGSTLHESGAVTWKAGSPDFSFVYDDSLLIVFGKTDLFAFNHIDTLKISGTGGIVFPLALRWKGNGGTVTWERAGMDPGEAYALLEDYTIDLSRSEYDADSAHFYFNRYFSLPVSGRLTDRLMSTSRPEDAIYPKFTSYRQEFSINEIYRGVDYEGGLSMEGAKLIGTGGNDRNAHLYFYLNGERWLTAESRYFAFRLNSASSANTSISFDLEGEYVFHPDLHLNYRDDTRELSLNSTDKVLSQSPWANQFHMVDMNFARLLWNIDDDEMRLTMPRASSIGNANFESLNFFDNIEFQRMQMMDAVHPLVAIKRFSEEYGAEEMPAEAYSRFMRRPLPGIRNQLLKLTLQGFIFYDTDSDIIRIRQRLHDYLQASVKRIDFDVINFASTVNAPQENALLDLKTLDLQINGIPRVFISNTQNVNIFPANNEVNIKKNRNFLFGGNINAGYLSFFGSNFAFDYDDFTINLQDVDSISLSVQLEETDLYGRALLTNVKNIIRNVTGMLFIDEPENKSGRVDYPEFPKFQSRDKSYVFYDDPEIQNGVYGSENFYFELYPFLMDSLNTFRNEDLRFKGKLISAGIFPEIEDSLILQEDFSLGINHTTVEEGLSLYEGKGRYYRDINLSNRGLRGGGRLDYLTTVLHSEEFYFYPDSMNTVADEFHIKRQLDGTQFPPVRSKNNVIQWLPHSGLMTVDQTDTKFAFFDEEAEMEGRLEIQPAGITGSGIINIGAATVTSDDFVFGAESLSAEDAGFLLHDPDKPDGALNAEGYSSFIDLASRKGEFRRPAGADRVSLTLNNYIADPEIFVWKMDEREVELVSEKYHPDTGLSGARYTSTARDQDSVYFYSPRATLNYTTGILDAGDVKLIEIADATIYPEDERLLVGERSSILPLKNARITANRNNSFHEIYDAAITIAGRNSYGGSGWYDYIDINDSVQRVFLDTISVNSNTETVASGSISVNNRFKLNPRFGFRGSANLLGSRKNIEFRGSAEIYHNCEGISDNWLAFEHIVDPAEVMIPVPSQPLSGEKERIYSGIFVATDSVHVYPAFLSTRKNYADQLIVTAEGFMMYDTLSGEYRISTPEKLKNTLLPGNYLSLNPDECILKGEGSLALGVTLGQLKYNAVGSATNMVNINETSLHGLITLDFFFSGEALSLMARQADSLPNESVEGSAYFFNRGLNEFLGIQEAENFRGRIDIDGNLARIPDELQKALVLSDISLKWDKESRSYRSQGKIGIAYINGMPVHKLFTGYLEITKRRSGDYLDLYIELSPDNWYYFGYTRGVMQAFSTNPEFLRIIEDTPLRHRRMRVPASETRYIYMLATDTKVSQFFNMYRGNRQGGVSDDPESQ